MSRIILNAVATLHCYLFNASIVSIFQTITELRAKYATYLTDHGHDQSKLSTPAFDGIWVAAKALTASIPQLEVNETLDQFTYSNERLMPMVFNAVKTLKFVGATVSGRS